jgi:3D (Asp-Asp-Asp) domain-containing protein
VTVAAHPQLPFGTRVDIPELRGIVGNGHTFIVQDRGSAVTSRKASRGKTDVIDVFVNSERKLRKITKTKPRYMKVRIVSTK